MLYQSSCRHAGVGSSNGVIGTHGGRLIRHTVNRVLERQRQYGPSYLLWLQNFKSSSTSSFAPPPPHRRWFTATTTTTTTTSSSSSNHSFHHPHHRSNNTNINNNDTKRSTTTTTTPTLLPTPSHHNNHSHTHHKQWRNTTTTPFESSSSLPNSSYLSGSTDEESSPVSSLTAAAGSTNRLFSSLTVRRTQIKNQTQQQQEHRRQRQVINLAMNLLLEEHQRRQRRFSSNNNSNNNNNNNKDKDEPNQDNLSDTTTTTTGATTIFTEDRNSTKNNSDDEINTSSSSSSSSSKKVERPPRMKVPNFGLGPDAHQAIRSLQKARKDRAHAKTATNVQRALIGNMVICVAKLGAWISSGSSSMMSEFVHSVVDCGNQSLLLMGLRDSRNDADRLHPYGYGKSVYFWALVSALGTFFLGAGVSMSHAIGEVLQPSLTCITMEVWGVLGLSFAIDGWVLQKTIAEIQESKPKHVSFMDHVSTMRDPATLAVLLEDGAACLGILIAIGGISATHITGMPIFDGMAGVGISCLLGSMGLVLVRMNHRFLLGQGVDRDMIDGIEKVILSRRSIDNVYSMQSQWTGPETFSFKAEVDFDGTYLAAQLMPRYQEEFQRAHEELDSELEVLLCWYAEDVIRAVEREVRHIEAKIRQKYPGAEYIELEPMSKDADKFAIDDSFEKRLHLMEKEEMQSFLKVLYDANQQQQQQQKNTTEENSEGTATTTTTTTSTSMDHTTSTK